jgi:predicted HTH domain antitoxin
MGLVIDDDLLHAARMSEPEIKLELAILLYQRERLTLGQAARLAGLSQARLRLLLGAREIAPHYGEAEFAEDLKVVRGGA